MALLVDKDSSNWPKKVNRRKLNFKSLHTNYKKFFFFRIIQNSKIFNIIKDDIFPLLKSFLLYIYSYTK